MPEIVLDKSSMAYNKGKIFIHGANKISANAFRKQFQTDLGGFLKMRSKEMKKGGSMFIALLGRTSEDPTDQGGAGLLFGTHFQDAWNDLVQEVLISYDSLSNQKAFHLYLIDLFLYFYNISYVGICFDLYQSCLGKTLYYTSIMFLRHD